MKSIRFTLRVATCGLFGLSAISSASADFSPVHNSGEADHLQILEGIYSPGTAWTRFGTRTDGEGTVVDLTNGTLSAIRIDDFNVEGAMDVAGGTPGSGDDRIWTGSLLDTNARARFAGFQQVFGIATDGTEGPIVTDLFTVGGSGLSVSGNANVSFLDPQNFNWTRGGDGDRYFSNPSLNPDGQDHMVTYQIQGFDDGLTHWMLFWEDLPNRGDVDYNDLGVEVTAFSVPEPGSLMLMIGGIAAAVLRRGR